MNHFDIGIAWDWEYDRDFVCLLNDTTLKRCFKPYLISDGVPDSVVREIVEGIIDWIVNPRIYT